MQTEAIDETGAEHQPYGILAAAAFSVLIAVVAGLLIHHGLPDTGKIGFRIDDVLTVSRICRRSV